MPSALAVPAASEKMGWSSEMGQTLPKWDVRATSAFPLIATEGRTSRDASNMTNSEVAFSFDHPVGGE